MNVVFWKIRSFWDIFAFIPLIQWLAFAFLVFFLALGIVVSELIVVVIITNALAWLTVVSTVFGSKHHEHLAPGWLYHLCAILFAPIVGVHYLYRTGQAHAQ